MSESISQFSAIDLPNHIAKEFSIDEKTGQGFVSRKGLARLCGVSHVAIIKLLSAIAQGNQNLPKNLKSFAGQDFTGGNQIPDVLAAAIIKYYDRKGNETAQNTSDALEAIGLRTFIQKTLDWKPPVTLTEKEIVALFVLPVAAPYSPKFEVEFYNQLSRLTGLKQQGHLRPHYWAQLTKELVYDYMPSGVYDEIKRWQRSTDPDKKTKVHQYMSEVGSETLINHLKNLLILMSAASSLSELKRSLNQSITKNYLPTFWEVK